MSIKVDPEDPGAKLIIQRQQAIAASVLSVGSRVDQASLKPKNDDKLAKLLEDLRATRVASKLSTQH